MGTIIAARRTLVANFTAKAAELALQGEGPQEIINRATLLGELYKDLLPNDFVDRVKKLEVNNLDFAPILSVYTRACHQLRINLA